MDSWKANGSNADYWRDDNPLIVAWHRFGDDLPPNYFKGKTPEDYLSGLMTDSSMTKSHLASKVDPALSFSPVSGLAPYSVSGIKFDGSAWVDGPVGNQCGLIHHQHIGTADGRDPQIRAIQSVGAGGFGYMGFGRNTANSGMMIAGWAQIEYPSQTPIAFRPLWGNHDPAELNTCGGWSVQYVAQDDSGEQNVLRLLYCNQLGLDEGGTVGTSPFWNTQSRFAQVDNGFTPFPTPIGEPFFWAFTIHRELKPDSQSPDPLQASPPYTPIGSGLMTMYMGTTTSGLFKVSERLISSTVQLVEDDANQPLGLTTIGQRALPDFSDLLGIPQNSILDELVFVQDGYMGFDRIEHYMNSGISVDQTRNPSRPEFEPKAPGTNKLQAYFTWDNNDSLENFLANSAPVTSGIFASYMSSDADDRPVPGIRGGSGLGLAIGGPRDNGSWTATANRTKWHVPIGSGRHYMWPDSNRAKGFTWIGWMRPAILNTNVHAPAVGFWTKQFQHQAWGPSSWSNTSGPATDGDHLIGDGVYTNSPGGMSHAASGIHYRRLGSTTAPNPDIAASVRGQHNMGPHADVWSLWAFVIDFENAVSYVVKDAKMLHLNPLHFSSSGWDDFALLNNDTFNIQDRTTNGSAFSFVSVPGFGFPFNPTTLAWVDDWAFYDRVLTIPEMSGYALSGIFVEPLVSPLNTSFKQTIGYWKLDGSGVYDPAGISGVRFDDTGWYRHHLTNVSGTFTQIDPLNSLAGENAIQVDTSGGMLSLEKIFIGANLDFSTVQAMPSSGFSAGMWASIPSGDIGTQGNGVSGLPGRRVLMGHLSQEEDGRSWMLGMNDNILEARVQLTNNTEYTILTNVEAPLNTPFFVGFDVQPSGSTPSGELDVLVGRVWLSESNEDAEITQIGEDFIFGSNTSILNPAGASGFSIFNAPHQDYGFPPTTAGQNAFVYAGALTEDSWGRVKLLGIDDTILGLKTVSDTDPANISHWKLDLTGSRFIDFGKEQNFLYPVNQDGNRIGIFSAVHESGVLIRQNEYYDTLPFNPSSRRLDLGSGMQSWTFLAWVFPPAPSLSDRHYIMAKSDGLSGIQIFTPAESLQATSQASGVSAFGENGDLAPDQWNHLAITFDRDNNEFTTMINGRYAGCTFEPLNEVPINNSGMALGGRGDQQLDALAGGSAFSGILDDAMLFSRALTLPEVSGLAENSYNFNDGSVEFTGGPIGAWISGLPQFIISGLIGAFMHGQAQDLELIGGYVSGVEGLCIPYGGYMHGKAFASGQIGAFLHGSQLASGVFGHFVHGLDSVSGFFGHYQFGACQANGEFDVTLNFSVVTDKDFDTRLGVEKTQIMEFDSRLGVVRITQPPICTFEAPLVGELGSGLPFVLTVSGSGIALNDKKIAATRFTFADFKGAEVGTLIDGTANSGLFEASREFDTPGWYTLKLEILDTFGYRSSCCRPFLLLPEGSTSGAFINSLPGISIESSSNTGGAINTVTFTHSISGLNTTSGLLEYTDFADQQESLVNSTEMPLGTQFVDFARRHDYTMPGRYCPVWTVSGEFGIVSDTIADGIDYLV